MTLIARFALTGPAAEQIADLETVEPAAAQ